VPRGAILRTLEVEGTNDAAVEGLTGWTLYLEGDGFIATEWAGAETVARRLLSERHPGRAISHAERYYPTALRRGGRVNG